MDSFDQNRLGHVLSASPAVIFTCGVTGDFPTTFISSNVEREFGYVPEEFLQDSLLWEKNIHPDDKERVLHNFKVVLFERGVVTHDYRFCTKEKKYKWLLDEMRLIRDAQGNPVEIVGSWMDISKEKEMESQLKDMNERFHLIVEASLDGISGVDKKGHFIFVNEAFAKMFGYTKEELSGRYFADIIPESQRGKVELVFAQLLTDDIVRGGLIVRHKNGESIPITISAAPMKKDGEIIGVTAIVRDMSSQKQLEIELIKHMNQTDRLKIENAEMKRALQDSEKT